MSLSLFYLIRRRSTRSNGVAFLFHSLELYKDPKDRSSIMQPGPLQKNAMHPQYIDILMQCIREPVIAHTGSFDQLEFCIWLVTEVTYHTEDLDDSNIVRGNKCASRK